MKKIIFQSLAAAFAASCLFPCLAACGEQSAPRKALTLDFSQKTGTEIQFIKKIDSHCPIWPLNGNMNATLNADALYTLNALSDLNAEYFRTDMFFGNYGLGCKIGSSSTLKGETAAEYGTTLQLAESLQKTNTTPYLILNGIPEYAQTNGYARKPDYEKYAEVMENVSAYLKASGVKAAYETWNEPDLGDWYDSVYDLMKTSATATAAVKRGDENAVVSALGLAFASNFFAKSETYEGVTMPNFERFLSESKKEAFPDALAWHYYGSETGEVEGNFDESADFRYSLDFMHENINRYADEYAELSTLQQHLTEYHPVSTAASKEDTTQRISAMFASIDPLLKATDVSRAFWPMYLSDDFGVVDKNSYRYNPSYSVLWCYGRLPVDRIAVNGLPEDLGVYAAADDSRAGAILFNRGESALTIDVELKGLPFEAASTDVYKISADHINYNGKIQTPYQLIHKTGAMERVSATLEANSACYIELGDESGRDDLDKKSGVELLKKEYYYDTRSYGMPYAETHAQSLTTHLSMADNEQGKTAISLRLKTPADLSVSYEKWGNFAESSGAALGFRVDFRRKDGTYGESVFYAFDGKEEEWALPFGTRRPADETIGLTTDKKGIVRVKLKDKAPVDWSGEIALTFLMKDAGKGATVKYKIHEG